MRPLLEVTWNEAKNRQLKKERGLSFENVVTALEEGRTLADIEHPHLDRKDRQRLLVVEIDGYACVVPYVYDSERMFLKTIYHSRAMQKKYLVKK
jgi:uncharacterized DUF497 family protein